ncbi:MAG: cation-transporting P-type ATPase, partial [Chloroflexota bacterium]
MVQTPPPLNDTTWYQLPAAEALQALAVDSTVGLTSNEAKTRLKTYGYNEIKFKKRGALTRFVLQFRSTLIYVLLAAAFVTAVLNMWVDAAVIFVVVIANAIIGFVQEGKAEASMDALTK